MPSNGDRNEPPLRGGRPGRWRRRILVAAIFIALLPLLVIGLVKTGVIAPLIENRAIAALNAALPDDLTADIGSSEVVAERFGIPAISTGDIFRANVGEGTPLGLEAKRIGLLSF